MISVKNLKKQYKEAVVLDVETLDISTSECFGLVGNNGAGKTTLFRIMLDLVRPTDGTVIINGHQVNQDEEWKKFTGAYLDEHMLLAYLTPDEYFQTLRKIYGMSEADLEVHLGKFTELFNDEIRGKKKYIRDLSKGNLKEKEDSRTTFLISSHDLNHVTEICDRIVLLEKGKIIRDLQEKEAMMSELEAYFTG